MVCPAFTLISVANPTIFDDPAPLMYHWLLGVPGRQFSASIGFLGVVQLPNAETTRPNCATTMSSTLPRAGDFPPKRDHHCAHCRRETSPTHSRAKSIAPPPSCIAWLA